MNPMIMKLFTWSGAVVVITWIVALVPLGQWMPADSPSDSALSVVHFYQSHTTAIRLGCCLMMLTGCLWATWGAVITMLIRRTERSWPILTYVALALVGGGYVFFELVPLFWVIPAFRPGAVSPDITQTFHDLGWFANIFTWPPFALFNVVVAVAIFTDAGAEPLFPRWIAHFNIGCAALWTPITLCAFVKTGPFAYSGVMANYMPFAVFFIWMAVMTIYMHRAVDGVERRRRDATALVTARHEPAVAVPAGA
jgi:hypothetical protein